MGTGSGVADVPSGGSSALLPQVARASKIAGGHFSAAARRKPTGLNVCRNGCAEMHRGGPYWLPPRRAPFGRKADEPPEGTPTRTAPVPTCEPAGERTHSPLLWERVARPDGVPRGRAPDSCGLPHLGAHASLGKTARVW